MRPCKAISFPFLDRNLDGGYGLSRCSGNKVLCCPGHAWRHAVRFASYHYFGLNRRRL